MNILVTGGTGFVGSHLVDLLLEKGHHVRLFSRRSDLPERWAGNSVTIVPGDLRDPDGLIRAMDGAEVVYHIGELANTSRAAARRNVRLVERMVEHLAPAGVGRFVFVSTISVGGVPNRVPADEDTAPAVELRDHYTEYKRESEALIARRTGEAEYVILRLPPVYGSRSRSLARVIPLFRRLARAGIPFIGRGTNLAPLVHVRDCARALERAGVKAEASGEIFNITDGVRHSWRDLFLALAQALGTTARIIPLPPFLLRLPAGIMDLLAGLVGVGPDLRHYLSFFSTDVHFDIGKARTLLAWEPEYQDLDAAMRELVGDYLVHQ